MIILNNQLTRSGIAYNIEISPHILKLEYEEDELEFVFSSNRYKEIFLRKMQDNRDKIHQALSKRYGFEIVNTINILADIKLYSITEKRGFLIKNREESYRCLNTIKLNGLNLTIKN